MCVCVCVCVCACKGGWLGGLVSKQWEWLTRRAEWGRWVDEVMVRIGHCWCEYTGTRLMHHKARTKMENSVITNWDL